MIRGARLAFALLGILVARGAFAQIGGTQLVGSVVDASTKKPVADVVVTATSPQLQGEQVVVTDAGGNYRIPQLNAGTYTLRFEKESYKPYSRSGIELRAESTIRLNIELLPESLTSEEIVVVGKPPTVDVGSTTTGSQISTEFIQNVPVTRGARTFDQLALVAPTVQTDFNGIAIAGATSPENTYLVDGLTTNNSFNGLNGSGVNVEFVDQVNVLTGGFMPEYGKTTGGAIAAFTKSGGNEFHGSVFGTWTPGGLAATPQIIHNNGATYDINTKVYNRWDIGATLGGYIIKDKLWFFAGFDANQVKNVRDRTIDAYSPNADCTGTTPGSTGNCPGYVLGNPAAFMAATVPNAPYPGRSIVPNAFDPATGLQAYTPVPGSDIRAFSNATGYQYIAKLTYLVNPDQRLSLSISGQPTSAYSFPVTAGPFDHSQAVDLPASFLDIIGKWSGSFSEKRILLDVTAGWHHESAGILPTDGSQPGATAGDGTLAGTSTAITRNYHNLTEFDAIPGNVQPTTKLPLINGQNPCTPITYAAVPATVGPPATPAIPARVFYPCPTSGSQAYTFGGPGFINDSTIDNVQGKAVATFLARAAGTHVIKGGAEVWLQQYNNTRSYTGYQLLRESATGGTTYTVIRGYGVLTAPDNPVYYPTETAISKTTSIGFFVQDSWSILDKVTLNVGLRYDGQNIYGADGELGLSVQNQWAPRIGVIWDPTYQGRSKIYANYGIYYENIPLDMSDRSFPGERQIYSARRFNAGSAGTAVGGAGFQPKCNPIQNPTTYTLQCQNPQGIPNGAPEGILSSSRVWLVTGGDTVVPDPNISAQSSSEVVIGGEYEIFANARLGASYTRRWMNKVVEDMSNDEAATYFIGNPGYGIADNFPKAVRNYTAVTVALTKNFADLWQAQISYTYQSLTGNYEGLILSGYAGGQTDPNITAAFDLRDLLPNSSGPLPGDITHTLKAFGSYEWVILPVFSATFGGAVVGNSGTPYSYRGAQEIYGNGIAFILPRGNAGTLPWVWDLDLKVGLNFRATKDTTVTFAVDCFNVFNSQQYTLIDQNYTFASVLPIIGTGANAQALKGDPSSLRYADNTVYSHADDNPNFGRPIAYQPARVFRFSAKVSF